MNAGRTIAGSSISPSASACSTSATEVTIVDQGTRRPASSIVCAERLAVLGAVDRVVVGADQLDAEPLEGAVVVQRLGQVQRRLAAERRQQRVGPLALDDPRHRLGRQRLDVGAVANSGSVMIVAGFELTSTTS